VLHQKRSEFETPTNVTIIVFAFTHPPTPSTANARPLGPPLWVLREGLRARKEGRVGLGSYWRGYKAPGEYNHPLPPYQLTPNPQPPLVYSRRGCCIHPATPFRLIVQMQNPKLSPCAQFRVFGPQNPLMFANAMPATTTTLSDIHHHHQQW